MRLGSAEQLREHLGGRLRPAYLVAGDEPLLVLEAVDLIRKAALASGCSERLVYDVAAGFDWADWRMQTRSYGLFASRRLLELRLANPRLTADGAEAVAAFVADPGDDLLLIQVPEWSKAAEGMPWVAAVERDGVVAIQRALRAEELPAWLRARARQLGLVLGEDAVLELVARVEGNLLAAQQELNKLVLLAPGRQIDAATLVDLVADSARYDIFALFDAVLAGRGERVRRVLSALRAEGSHPAEVFGYLVNQVAALAGAEALRARGASLHSWWPTRGVFGARQGAFERALGRGWIQRMNESQQIDMACKGRAAGEPWVELERWLLRSTLPAARAARFAA